MALASTLATNLTTGSSAGVAASGSIMVVITGNFGRANQDPGISATPGSVYIEVSGDGGSTYAPLNETTIFKPQAFDLDLATGSVIRLTVATGLTLSGNGVTALFGALP
jgi:hypothetical protein